VKRIIFSKHALERLKDRGASEEEVEKAIREGERIPAKRGYLATEKIFFLILSGKVSIIK